MLLLLGRCSLAPTGNQSFPCLPKLACQNMCPLPNEGAEKREGRRGGGRKPFFVSQKGPLPSEHVPFSSQQMGSEVGKGVHCKSAPSATIHFGFAALAINVYNPWISASCPQTCIPSPSQPVFHVSALNLRRELGNSHS